MCVCRRGRNKNTSTGQWTFCGWWREWTTSPCGWPQPSSHRRYVIYTIGPGWALNRAIGWMYALTFIVCINLGYSRKSEEDSRFCSYLPGMSIYLVYVCEVETCFYLGLPSFSVVDLYLCSVDSLWDQSKWSRLEGLYYTVDFSNPAVFYSCSIYWICIICARWCRCWMVWPTLPSQGWKRVLLSWTRWRSSVWRSCRRWRDLGRTSSCSGMSWREPAIHAYPICKPAIHA